MRMEGFYRAFFLLLVPFGYALVSGGSFILFYLCLFLVAVDLAWALNSGKIAVRIDSLSSSVQTGQETGLLLEAKNPTRWPVPWVQCLVDLPETFAVEGNIGCYNLSLKPLGGKTVSDLYRCSLRGNYTWGTFVVRTGGILGVFTITRLVEKQLELEVLPRFFYMGNILASLTGGRLKGLQAGSARSGRRGNDLDNFLGIRAYNRTDALSRIHWKASARMNSLYVKELGESRQTEFLVYLDNGENFINTVSKAKDFEADITITASIIATLLKNCHGAGLVSGGKTELPAGIGRGKKHFRQVLGALAGMVPAEGGKLREGLAWAASGCPPGTGIVVVTRHLDADSALLLRGLRSRGYICTVFLVCHEGEGSSLGSPLRTERISALGDIPVIALDASVTALDGPVVAGRGQFGWSDRGA